MDMRELFADILTQEVAAEEEAAYRAEQDLLVLQAKRSLGIVGPIEVAMAQDTVEHWYERAATRLLHFRRWVAAPAEA